MQNNYVIIMAGGIGSRFWPFSRKTHPKQFHDMLGTGKTLLQQTAERFEGICPPENIYIVTNNDYKSLVKEQLPYLSDDQVLLEPVMRNTAPCIAYASYKIAKQNPDANLIISPADHLILKEDKFRQTLETAIEQATAQEILVTLGIRPSRPDTGYGYIQSMENEKIGPLLKVKTFTEKPSLDLAKEFLESGDFVWNSGIFIWRARTILNNFNKHLPEVGNLFREIEDKFYTDKEEAAILQTYYQCRNISIDYGIMEKAERVYVLPSDFGWSDLGTWKSLFEVSEKNEHGNVIQANAITYDTTNTIIKNSSERLMVVQGLDNYIVTEHDNVLLVCEKEKEQQIKQFLNDAKEQKGEQFS